MQQQRPYERLLGQSAAPAFVLTLHEFAGQLHKAFVSFRFRKSGLEFPVELGGFVPVGFNDRPGSVIIFSKLIAVLNHIVRLHASDTRAAASLLIDPKNLSSVHVLRSGPSRPKLFHVCDAALGKRLLISAKTHLISRGSV
jgi:hypothetical protein